MPSSRIAENRVTGREGAAVESCLLGVGEEGGAGCQVIMKGRVDRALGKGLENKSSA
ncbi:hypothetical protein Ssi02_58680 [Sinosporangium siamense]|uniref:Uncharacterized protein n=1 Tax=Sinosporangium siamense TaxID=1367973 RepID=A0A919RLZ0_9ACTN|nr:hypothetical protein Ssi02_58680 [Sinosporangium siamense]